MENFLLFNSINFFALAVLAILLIDMSLYLSRNKDFHKSIWRDALLFALLAQTLDIACWFVNGRQGVFYTIMGYGLNVLLFSISALMVAKMAMYIQYSSDFKIESYKKLKTICYFTVAYVAILCTVSIWGHFIFSVDSNNLYHREDWYYLMMAGVFFPVGYIFVKLVLKYAKTFNRILKDNKMIILLLIINIIVPIGLIVLQGMNVTNVAVIFPFITLSTVIMHLITMANTAGTDFLTKLKNNFGVNKHFAYFPKITNYYYAIVFFDLNNFKFINDKFGHKEGDEVLKAFAEILAKEIKSGDIAARHGGDEFFIGVTLKDPEELDSIIKSIQAEVNKYNQTVKNYKMSFSYGISINKPRHSLNYEQLINEADEKMYSNKSISKQLELDI